jgi:hypothetical protein
MGGRGILTNRWWPNTENPVLVYLFDSPVPQPRNSPTLSMEIIILQVSNGRKIA